ncbi:MAG: hypothetical protein ABEJ61_08260 [Haloferacaceae archaeon]
MTRRRLLLAATVAVVLAFVTSTGAVSTVTMDRGVEVAVADDPNAYLGVERAVTGVGDGTANLSVTVTNRFPSGADLATVEVTVDGTTADLARGDPLAPGESATHAFRSVGCGDRIAVEAFGDGVRVRLYRSVTCG